MFVVTRAKLMLTVQVSETQTLCLLSPEVRTRLQAAGSPASCPAPASPACHRVRGSKGLEERVEDRLGGHAGRLTHRILLAPFLSFHGPLRGTVENSPPLVFV